MTQSLERALAESGRSDELARLGLDVSEDTTRPWWRRPWVIPLALSVGVFLIYAMPRYLTFNPARSLVPVGDQFSLRYAVLQVHVLTGAIALITVILQVWPWLRRRHPAIHRVSGRVYIYAGALPASLSALVLLRYTSGPGWVGRHLLAVLWLVTTVVAVRAARKQQWVDHRRYMLYSFALAMDGVGTRVILILLGALPVFGIRLPLFPEPLSNAVVFEAAGWCAWVLNLIAVQWWLNRTGPSAGPPTPLLSRPAEAA